MVNKLDDETIIRAASDYSVQVGYEASHFEDIQLSFIDGAKWALEMCEMASIANDGRGDVTVDDAVSNNDNKSVPTGDKRNSGLKDLTKNKEDE